LDDQARADRPCCDRRSDREGQLIEGGSEGRSRPGVDTKLVVHSAQILDERMTSRDPAGGPVSFQSAHWTEPGLQTAMVGLDPVMGLLICVMQYERQELDDRSSQGW
jgi:hypothetical protein